MGRGCQAAPWAGDSVWELPLRSCRPLGVISEGWQEPAGRPRGAAQEKQESVRPWRKSGPHDALSIRSPETQR